MMLNIVIRADVTTAEAGQCVSLALKRVRRATVRKGMVLVHKMEAPPRGNLPPIQLIKGVLINDHSRSPV
jgi:hypothetical protein